MIDHVGIVVTDYPRAKAFYTAALAPIGAKMQLEFNPPEGNHVSGWGRSIDAPTFWISTCPEGSKQKPPVHVAFTCPDRAQVDAFYTAALEAGGKDHGKPGLRPHYHPNYYGAFITDPDGHNIEAVCHAPA